MSGRYVLPLADCALEEAGRVGGKAVGLGRLLRQSLTVPPGFVVTAGAYRDWVAGRALQQHLDRLLAEAADAASERAVAARIQALFDDAEPAGDLVAEIGAAYAGLGEGADVPAAVRSSATAEDRRDASFAGQQETFLGVTGTTAVVRHVVRCWASLFTPHAIGYRRRLAVPADQVAMAVVVQRVVPAEASGVMLTVDPVTGDPSQIEIEATHGLGMPLVGGEITPDRYSVDKVSLEIRSRAIARQPFADRLDPATGAVVRVDLPGEEGGSPCLQEPEVALIAETGRLIEQAQGGPVDVEWAIGPGPAGSRQLSLLQSRPETVWSRRRRAPVAQPGTTPLDRIVSMMLKGVRTPGTRSQT